MNEETVTFKRSEVDRLKENFRQLRDEIDTLKREKDELRELLTPVSVDEVFSFDDEVEEEVEYGSVSDLALNVQN